jgi:hypothetical protein
LLVNNTSGSGTGTGTVQIYGGATLGGTGTITPDASQSKFVQALDGAHIAPGASVLPAAVGALKIEKLFTSNAFLDLDGSGATMDRLNVGAGGFFPSGTNTINVNNLGGLASGDYVILDYTNDSPLADLSNFQLGTTPSGYNMSLVHDSANQNILLHVLSTGPAQWALDAAAAPGTPPAAGPAASSPIPPPASPTSWAKSPPQANVTLDGSKQVQEMVTSRTTTNTPSPPAAAER